MNAEDNTEQLYRSKFWRTYIAAVLISIVLSLIIGLSTSSIWIGLVSYFAINTLLSLSVLYKFSIDSENL